MLLAQSWRFAGYRSHGDSCGHKPPEIRCPNSIFTAIPPAHLSLGASEKKAEFGVLYPSYHTPVKDGFQHLELYDFLVTDIPCDIKMTEAQSPSLSVSFLAAGAREA